ncbi:MAG: glycosyltransferase family 2 protein [bacterium]
MNSHKPRVSIGLPVFNGENYLEETLKSILSQTYSDFELIISDNASTDNTQKICQDYAARDQRVRYFRNEENIGAARNFNRVFELSSGQYFKWAAHDDLIAPDYLQKCVKALAHDSSAILSQARVKIIDKDGQVMKEHSAMSRHAYSPRPSLRFKEMLKTDLRCFEVFGLIRASLLKKTPLIASYIASDRPLRAELALLGHFHEIPESLFLSRDHPKRSARAMPAHHQRAAWFDPAKAGKIVLPHWRIFFEYYMSIG